MPVIVQTTWLTRCDIQAHPERRYAWSDNLARMQGPGHMISGQALACRGEFNAIGIATKRSPATQDNDFLRDSDVAHPGCMVRSEIDAAFYALETHLHNGGTVVWPVDGIGGGIGGGSSDLNRRAPAVLAYIEAHREAMFSRYGVITEVAEVAEVTEQRLAA